MIDAVVNTWKVCVAAQLVGAGTLFAFGILTVCSIMTVCNVFRLIRRYK